MIKNKILKEMNKGGMWWINSKDIPKDKEFKHRLMTDKVEVEELIDLTLKEVKGKIKEIQKKIRVHSDKRGDLDELLKSMEKMK